MQTPNPSKGHKIRCPLRTHAWQLRHTRWLPGFRRLTSLLSHASANRRRWAVWGASSSVCLASSSKGRLEASQKDRRSASPRMHGTAGMAAASSFRTASASLSASNASEVPTLNTLALIQALMMRRNNTACLTKASCQLALLLTAASTFQLN